MALYMYFFLNVFFELILFNSLFIHILDTALFSSGCALFSVSHHLWVRQSKRNIRIALGSIRVMK